MQAALVRERAAADVGLRAESGHVRDFGDIAAGVREGGELLVGYALDAELEFEVRYERDEVCVAAALSIAVHCALHLRDTPARTAAIAPATAISRVVVRVDA